MSSREIPPLRGGEALSHDLDEPSLEEVRGPRGIREEVLDPIDGGLGEPMGDGLHGLPLAGEQETGEVSAGIAASVLRPCTDLEEVRERLEESGESVVPEAGASRRRHPEKSVEGE